MATAHREAFPEMLRPSSQFRPAEGGLTTTRPIDLLRKTDLVEATALSCFHIMLEKRGRYGHAYTKIQTHGANWQYPKAR